MNTNFTYALAIIAVAGMLSSCDGNGKKNEGDSLQVDSSVNVNTDTTAVVDTSAKDTLTTPDSSTTMVVPKNDTVGKVVTKETTVKKKVTKTDN